MEQKQAFGFMNTEIYAEMKAKAKVEEVVVFEGHQHKFRNLDSVYVSFDKPKLPECAFNLEFWNGSDSLELENELKFNDRIMLSDYINQYKTLSERQLEYEEEYPAEPNHVRPSNLTDAELEKTDSPNKFEEFQAKQAEKFSIRQPIGDFAEHQRNLQPFDNIDWFLNKQPIFDSYADLDQGQKISLFYPSHLDRMLFEELQVSWWNGSKTMRPPQLIASHFQPKKDESEKIHHYLGITPEKGEFFQSLHNEIGLSHDSQKVLNQYIRVRNGYMGETPELINMSDLNWGNPIKLTDSTDASGKDTSIYKSTNPVMYKKRQKFLIQAIDNRLSGNPTLGSVADDLAKHIVETHKLTKSKMQWVCESFNGFETGKYSEKQHCFINKIVAYNQKVAKGIATSKISFQSAKILRKSLINQLTTSLSLKASRMPKEAMLNFINRNDIWHRCCIRYNKYILRCIKDVMQKSKIELFQHWIKVSQWASGNKLIAIREFAQEQGLTDVNEIETKFNTSAKWHDLLMDFRNVFNEEFGCQTKQITMQSLHKQFIEPSKQEMKEALQQIKDNDQLDRLMSQDTNLGYSLEYLMDIKTSKLQNLDVSDDETLQEVQDRLIEYRNAAHYEPCTYTKHTEKWLEDKEYDDMDSGDFEYESLESDEKASKASDQDAFTYSSCVNFTVQKQCSKADAAIIRACKDCQTEKDLKFFKKLRANDMEGSWDSYRVLKDTIYFTEKRIND